MKTSGKKNADVNQVTTPNVFGDQNSHGDKKNAMRNDGAGNCDAGLARLDVKLDLIVSQLGECVEVIPVVRGLEKDARVLQQEMKDMKDKSVKIVRKQMHSAVTVQTVGKMAINLPNVQNQKTRRCRSGGGRAGIWRDPDDSGCSWCVSEREEKNG